jgi:hypothetical protein
VTGFQKILNIRFHEIPSSGSRIVLYGQTGSQRDGQINMTNLIVAVRNFANVPKNIRDLNR